MIKDFFFEGKSTSDIAWELNKRKIKPRRATEWRSSSIANILQNEVYVGNIVYNKSVGNKNLQRVKLELQHLTEDCQKKSGEEFIMLINHYIQKKSLIE